MSREIDASQADLDLKALEQFVVGNEDLEHLEALLRRFNIFEAIGVVRQELRHSDFLAYLLDPRENHGMGDAFVKRLLQTILVTTEAVLPVTAIELELWDLDRIEVRREWQHIDILLVDHEHELVVLIENKIYSGEHSDQLRKCLQTVKQHYPEGHTIGLYLSPDGDPPSHEAYSPVSYRLVCEVIDGLAERRASIVNPDVQTLLSHYTEMLRRNILGDSEIAELCRQIYRKHKRALDLIYAHLPDVQEEIKDLVEGLIEEEPRFWFHPTSGKSKIKFGVRGWDAPALKWMVWFEVWNYPGSLTIKLYVGPGNEETRQRLFEIVRDHPEVFRGGGSRFGSKWANVFSRPWLEQEMYDDADQEDREKEIRRHWAEFLEGDLPRIDAVLKAEEWIWEAARAAEEDS